MALAFSYAEIVMCTAPLHAPLYRR